MWLNHVKKLLPQTLSRQKFDDKIKSSNTIILLIALGNYIYCLVHFARNEILFKFNYFEFSSLLLSL